jgi:formylmethanofuran dehydrogenase subunit E
MFLLAFVRIEEPKPMSEKEIRDWTPEVGELPEGAEGSVMYRIDTTIDEPVRTSVLCGKCGELTWVDGLRPQTFICLGCDTMLWDKPLDDEEE